MSVTRRKTLKSTLRPASAVTVIQVRVRQDQLKRLDGWIARQVKPHPSRPEALRRLAEVGLAADPARGPFKDALKAAELAGSQIDRMSDPLASDEQRQSRKRRLIKGPKEFRDPKRSR